MKLFQQIILVPTVALAVSCQMSDIDCAKSGVTENSVDVTITATLEAGLSTKTSLDGDGRVIWSADDEFALLNSNGSDKFTLVSGTGTQNGVFSGSISGVAPYYALYPYSSFESLSNGEIRFKLPQEQAYAAGSFANGASPAIATISDLSTQVSFKNICAALELSLTGTCSVATLIITDLSGSPLWGDCALVIDGDMGTDNQKLNITNGNNQLILKLPKETKLSSSSPKKFVVIVPPGSLSKGFSVKILDGKGNAAGFLTTQSQDVIAQRSVVTNMNQVSVPDNGEPLDTLARGHYKDVFQNGGCHLTSNLTLPAASYLGWTFDSMGTAGSNSAHNLEDSLFQRRIIIGDDKDLNGALLYPDGEPRYRMVYFNGGYAGRHGTSLTEAGRSNVVTYIRNGGSYVGTCAGAYITSEGTTSTTHPEYLKLIPSRVVGTGYTGTTGMFIPETSPLLKYYNYGNDLYVAEVRQAGGCYLPDSQVPDKGEILMRYDMPTYSFHNKISVWAYKANASSGRVIACGGHPEQVESGERRDMMAAMMRYACDGNGGPDLKATLSNGVARTMNRQSGSPAYSTLGDKQYHHYRVRIPAGAKNFKLSVVGDGSHTLHVAMRKGSWAWRMESEYLLAQATPDKTLELDTIDDGTWFISVYCPESIKVRYAKNVFEYYDGDVAILNGIPYTITASWE